MSQGIPVRFFSDKTLVSLMFFHPLAMAGMGGNDSCRSIIVVKVIMSSVTCSCLKSYFLGKLLYNGRVLIE